MRLVLFDIDGTLIDSGGAGVRALNRAMQNLFAIENAFAGIGMAGRTDTEIIKDGLRKHGLPSEKTGDVVDAYLSYLSEEIRNDRKYVKPGIYEVLSALQAFAHVATGLLTGNLERGARIKLDDLLLLHFVFYGEDEPTKVSPAFEIIDHHPLDPGTYSLKDHRKEVMSKRTLLGRIVDEHANGRTHISIHIDDEGLVLVPKKDRDARGGGDEPPNANRYHGLGHAKKLPFPMVLGNSPSRPRSRENCPKGH